MKKHDEGYVLPLVLVVMIVMCLIATSLMSFSLQNLKSQQASIERMQDKYVAEGAVEIVVTELIEKNVTTIECDVIESNAKQKSQCDEVMCKISNIDEKYVAEITARKQSVELSCELVLLIEKDEIKAISYKAYDISNIGGEGT